MPRKLGLRRGGAREAAEEACALARCSERGRMLGRKFVERGSVELNTRSCGRVWQPLGGAAQTVRTVATRPVTRLAEVADERLHLAAVVLDEGDNPCDPLRLRLLAPVEALGEAISQLLQRR